MPQNCATSQYYNNTGRVLFLSSLNFDFLVFFDIDMVVRFKSSDFVRGHFDPSREGQQKAARAGLTGNQNIEWTAQSLRETLNQLHLMFDLTALVDSVLFRPERVNGSRNCELNN